MTNLTQTDWIDEHPQTQLSPGFPDKMVLLDCETTGGRASYHRITEIGLLVVEGGQVVEQWQTLINPERSIPAGITRLTGITQEMVNQAPKFAEVADELLAKLNDRVLVAHHARFDYGFLKREFARMGVKYHDQPLCSVKISRLLYPQFKRHGLDHIIRRFGLSINNRHRAMDDAQMIWRFFLKTSQIHQQDDIKAVCDQLLKEHTLPSRIRRADIDRLPRSPGVYYFYDERDVLLYVGKSINIRQRVLSHFSQDHQNHKDLKMSASIARIEFDSTLSDFGAQILESNQIKELRPLYNTRLRKIRRLFRMSCEMHERGYLYPDIKAVDIDDSDHIVQDLYGLFRSPRQAQKKLLKLADHFMLCHRLLGLEPGGVASSQPCFRYQLKKCQGACCGQESFVSHNQRLQQALRGYQQKVWPWQQAIVVEERAQVGDEWEQQFHLVDDWVYLQRIHAARDLMDLGYHWQQQPDLPRAPVKQNKTTYADRFDLDIYFILVRFLLDPEKLAINNIRIHELFPITESTTA